MAQQRRNRKRPHTSQRSREQDTLVPSSERQECFGLPKGALRRGEELFWDEDAAVRHVEGGPRRRVQANHPDWVEDAWTSFLGSATRRPVVR